MRKILIIGPLVDNGGREVETNIIAKSLENDYDLTILSTVHATPKSIVGEGLKKTFFTTLDKEFIKTNFIIFCFAFLFFIKNKFKGDVSLYVKNKLTFFFFNYSQLRNRFLLKYIDKFLKQVDAAAVYANASTAFTDGNQFGMGAEIGISTQKLHARGPMALRELTSYKWIIEGNGQVR